MRVWIQIGVVDPVRIRTNMWLDPEQGVKISLQLWVTFLPLYEYACEEQLAILTFWQF
jgi:hypothetical protein